MSAGWDDSVMTLGMLFGRLYSSRGVAVLYIDNTCYTHNIPFLLCLKIKLACFTLHALCFMLHVPYFMLHVPYFMLHVPYLNKNFLSPNPCILRSCRHRECAEGCSAF